MPNFPLLWPAEAHALNTVICIFFDFEYFHSNIKRSWNLLNVRIFNSCLISCTIISFDYIIWLFSNIFWLYHLIIFLRFSLDHPVLNLTQTYVIHLVVPPLRHQQLDVACWVLCQMSCKILPSQALSARGHRAGYICAPALRGNVPVQLFPKNE